MQDSFRSSERQFEAQIDGTLAITCGITFAVLFYFAVDRIVAPDFLKKAARAWLERRKAQQRDEGAAWKVQRGPQANYLDLLALTLRTFGTARSHGREEASR